MAWILISSTLRETKSWIGLAIKHIYWDNIIKHAWHQCRNVFGARFYNRLNSINNARFNNRLNSNNNKNIHFSEKYIHLLSFNQLRNTYLSSLTPFSVLPCLNCVCLFHRWLILLAKKYHLVSLIFTKSESLSAVGSKPYINGI